MLVPQSQLHFLHRNGGICICTPNDGVCKILGPLHGTAQHSLRFQPLLFPLDASAGPEALCAHQRFRKPQYPRPAEMQPVSRCRCHAIPEHSRLHGNAFTFAYGLPRPAFTLSTRLGRLGGRRVPGGGRSIGTTNHRGHKFVKLVQSLGNPCCFSSWFY